MTAEERAKQLLSVLRRDGIHLDRGAAQGCVADAIRAAESDARRQALEEAAEWVEEGLSFHSYAGGSAAAIIRTLAAKEPAR